MVCAARGAVTKGTGAMETEGALPDGALVGGAIGVYVTDGSWAACPNAVPVSRRSENSMADFFVRKIIFTKFDSRAIAERFLLSPLSSVVLEQRKTGRSVPCGFARVLIVF